MSQWEVSQPDKRRPTAYTDQHGRVWFAIIEIRNGMPCSPITPNGWDAPLMPDQKYLQLHPNHPGEVFIKYDEWISDIERNNREYEQRRMTAARALYGERAGQMLKQNPQELTDLLGADKIPVEPVVAASRGNKWVLGLSDRKPDWAKAFFSETPKGTVADQTLAQYADMEFPDVEEPVKAGK